MTRVDFYLAQEDRPQAALRVACRLAEKAYKLGHRVYLHTGSVADAQRLDDMLWTFRDVAFIPHALDNDDAVPVIIGHGMPPDGFDELLINLAGEVPGFAERFTRVAEVVGAGDEDRAQGRRRWKHYRDKGCELESHEV